ncbi:MAG: YceI family protein [Novosphingobium sp.]
MPFPKFQFRCAIAAALAGAALWSFQAFAGQPQHYNLDSTNSAVSARVSFLGLASRTAHFPELSGRIRLDPDRPGPVDLDVVLNARALTTRDRETLNRLKGPHFFDVEHHPTIRFSGRTMTLTGPRTARVEGELTTRGVTRRELLQVTFERDPTRATGREPVSFSGVMTIDRRNYGMRSYSFIVGNRVTIAIRARMVPS